MRAGAGLGAGEPAPQLRRPSSWGHLGTRGGAPPHRTLLAQKTLGTGAPGQALLRPPPLPTPSGFTAPSGSKTKKSDLWSGCL